MLSQLYSSQVVLYEDYAPAIAPETSPSPVRDDSESPKEEDFVGAYMGHREPISTSLDRCKDDNKSSEFFKIYAQYRQDVPDKDPVRRFMKWSLNNIKNIQAQLESQDAKSRDLEARVSARLQQLETKFDEKASDTDYYLALHGDAILGVSSIFTCTLFLLNTSDCRV